MAGTGSDLPFRPIRSAPSTCIDHVDRLAARHNRKMMVQPRQGRLLGYGGEAGAGARTWPTTRCSPASPRPMPPIWPAPSACSTHARGILPQFATHNALTVAMILQTGGRRQDGLRVPAPARHGRTAFTSRSPRRVTRSPAASTRRLGGYRDPLADLVRRLLENGANSSFVSVVGDNRRADCRPADPPGRQTQ